MILILFIEKPFNLSLFVCVCVRVCACLFFFFWNLSLLTKFFKGIYHFDTLLDLENISCVSCPTIHSFFFSFFETIAQSYWENNLCPILSDMLYVTKLWTVRGK